MTTEEYQLRNRNMPTMANNRNDNRPEETAHERLLGCIIAIEQVRRRGIIEVVLTASQSLNWRTILEAEGFKLVTEGVNSNTNHTLHVYHYVYGQ